MTSIPYKKVVVQYSPEVRVVEVASQDPDRVSVVRITVPGPQGPTGLQGPSGDSFSFEYSQPTALGVWSIPVPPEFNRRPTVTVYLATGELVISDVVATSSLVTITFASPVAGTAVLT